MADFNFNINNFKKASTFVKVNVKTPIGPPAEPLPQGNIYYIWVEVSANSTIYYSNVVTIDASSAPQEVDEDFKIRFKPEVTATIVAGDVTVNMTLQEAP